MKPLNSHGIVSPFIALYESALLYSRKIRNAASGIDLKVRQVVLDLLGTQFSEPWALCALHAFDSEKMICRGSDDT